MPLGVGSEARPFLLHQEKNHVHIFDETADYDMYKWTSIQVGDGKDYI
jgi:hypothetical protein